MKRAWVLVLLACGASTEDVRAPRHSSSIAVSRDGRRVYVVNPDADSVSILDAERRVLLREVALGPTPTTDADGAYTPAVMPRALALSLDEQTLFVSGQRSGKVHAVSLSSFAVKVSGGVGSEPVGLVVADDGAVLVASSQDARVVKLDPHSLAITGSVTVAAQPWALGLSRDGSTLLVTHPLSAQVTPITLRPFEAGEPWVLPEVVRPTDARLAQGVARSLFDVAARPGHRETWVAHSLLAQRTPMPTLGFATTAFPALSVLFDGVVNQTLSTDAQDVPGIDGALADVVSGPRALAFTPDGRFAVVVDQASEDVLVVDAEAHVQRSLVRPMPGHLLEGLAMSSDGHTVYLDERGSGDVAVLTLDDAGQAQVDGAPIARLVSDPMPSQLRLGQRLFFSANSDVFPITTNHWVACATCHPEGRSDAVTWLFEEGPRDTPSNAGGTRGTGFLMRGAERRRVQDYWVTINVEQGGHFRPDDPVAQPLLDSLAAFVDFGLPAPIPPATDPALVAKGKALFERADVACATCHFGPRLTDSGRGNLGLDLSGHLELHDVGTCVTTGFADAAHQDVDGNPREACQFDTPSLVGLAASPPYLHDGSAATLMDVLTQTRGKMGDVRSLNDDELAALVEYLRSL